jgi:4'-phosphopantetheinyl transferase
VTVELYCVEIDPGQVRSTGWPLLPFLSRERRDQIGRFVHEHDAHRSLVAEVLLRSLIGRHLGLANSEMDIRRTPYGKPYLQGHPEFQFNLSHSGRWVSCALHREEVGVDVQQIQPTDLEVARRYFSSAERRAIEGQRGVAALRRFYEIWTLKESYIKARGLGLSLSLDSFDVTGDTAGEPLEETLRIVGPAPGYSLRQYHLDDEHCLALCARGGTPPAAPQLSRAADLFDRFATYVAAAEPPPSRSVAPGRSSTKS